MSDEEEPCQYCENAGCKYCDAQMAYDDYCNRVAQTMKDEEG